MSGVNKVFLIGNLGKDPEIKQMQNGSTLANFSVATSESWKDKTTGEMKEVTEWHRVTMFGRLADIAGQYLRKGSKVYIEGSLTTRKWQDKQTGQDRYMTEIKASSLQMLDGRAHDAGHQEPSQKSPVEESMPQNDGFDDDSIPF